MLPSLSIWQDWLVKNQNSSYEYTSFAHSEYHEDASKRDHVLKQVASTIHDYHSLNVSTSSLLLRLGYPSLSSVIKDQNHPEETNKTQKAHFLEVLATEYMITFLGHNPPLKRLRFNPNKEQSMKGDDLLGFDFSRSSSDIGILVGEVKYKGDKYVKQPVLDAIEVLEESLSPLPLSLQFVINLLEYKGDKKAADTYRQLKMKLAVDGTRVRKNYLLFVGSLGQPNDPFEAVMQRQPTLPNLTAVNVVFDKGIDTYIEKVFWEIKK